MTLVAKVSCCDPAKISEMIKIPCRLRNQFRCSLIHQRLEYINVKTLRCHGHPSERLHIEGGSLQAYYHLQWTRVHHNRVTHSSISPRVNFSSIEINIATGMVLVHQGRRAIGQLIELLLKPREHHVGMMAETLLVGMKQF